MAGDWIKMRTDLIDDPSVVAMAIALELDEFSVVGRLHKLWSWADRHTVDGIASGVNQAWIDRYLDKPGFSAAMVSAGWLVIHEDGIEFPSFARHNGSSAKARAEATARKQTSRACHGNVTEMSQETCDRNATREEKRREEKIECVDHRLISCLRDNHTLSAATEWCLEKFRSPAGGKPALFTQRQATESRGFLLRIAAIALSGAVPEAWSADAIEGMRRLQTMPSNPAGYLRKVLRESPHIRGRPPGWFDALLKSIEVPPPKE